MKKAFFVVVGTLLVSGSAFAGATQPRPVSVSFPEDFPGGGTALGQISGNMVSARTAADDRSYISCFATTFESGTVAVFCLGQDAEGDFAICSSGSEELMEAVRSINDYSFVSVAFNDTDENPGVYECKVVTVHFDSRTLPKIKE